MPRKNASKNRSSKYENLYRMPWSEKWVFRKYHSAKRDTFTHTTAFLAKRENEAKAYKEGVEEFNAWVGYQLPQGRALIVRDLAQAVLASKQPGTPNHRFVKNQVDRHVIPNFGHYRPDQVTKLVWDTYEATDRQRDYTHPNKNSTYRRTRYEHTLRILMECLRRGKELGALKELPELETKDEDAAPPVHHDHQTMRRIFRAYPRPTTSRVPVYRRRGLVGKLLAYVLYRQGPRPGEACQYERDMITFRRERLPGRRRTVLRGTLRIPGRITKTRRPREIPMNSRVARILNWWLTVSPSQNVFPSPTDPHRPMREYDSAWISASRRAGVVATIYTLRDTAITNMLERASSTTVAKYVDSSGSQIDKRYAVARKQLLERAAG